MLQDSQLDYVEDLSSAAFGIKSPNATAKCGCGNSFALYLKFIKVNFSLASVFMKMLLKTLMGLILFFITAQVAYAADEEYAFKHFPAIASFNGKPASPIVKGKLRKFKTTIRRNTTSGVNFAGAYTIITWGCGSNCQRSVLFDPKTGAVYPLGDTELGLEYRKDSRLLVLNPMGEIPYYETVFTDSKPRYMVWNGKTMQTITKEKAVIGSAGQ